VERNGASQRQVVWAMGEIDLATAPQLRDRLLDAFLDGHGDVVVEMSRVTFLDSTGVGVLANVGTRLRADDRRLILQRPSDKVRRVLEICSLPQLLQIEEAENHDEAGRHARPADR
jgi:anti-sigma B factor antagonist